MNKKNLWSIVIIAGFCIWSFKVFNTAQAYYVAKSTIENDARISAALGDYHVNYDWWFGVFRALKYGKIQEFEFHLQGSDDNAVGVVELAKTNSRWTVTCFNVVNGEYLNKRIVQQCNS